MKGIITNIQRYSIHDGPGIRTVVFFKGCPLACLWCCNPETQSFNPEVEFINALCQHCGDCRSVCPRNAVNPNLFCDVREKIDRKLCDACGKCVKVCPNDALKMIGEEWKIDDVLKVIVKDRAYYRRSGGGVTLSGGEPLSQPEFAFKLLSACNRNNFHTAIETCGIASRDIFEKILPFTDLFLFDIKHIDCAAHRQLTGLPNKEILENLHWLVRKGANIILRVPLVSGLNTDSQVIMGIGNLAAELEINEIHLMPFHQMGKDKYKYLGKEYSLAGNQDMRVNEEGKTLLRRTQHQLSQKGITVFIGG